MRTMLNQIEMDHIMAQLKDADVAQLLLINRTAADYFKMQRKIEGRQAMTDLKVGTKVMFVHNMRPQYLASQFGEIVEIRQTRVTVKLDRGPMGKFRSGKVITDPTSLVIRKSQPVGE
jgi:hypothetical protein